MRTQSARYRVAVDVVQFLPALVIVTNIEVVVTFLPEVIAAFADQASRNSLFQRLQRCGQRLPLGFAQQQMYMFRHDDVSVDAEPVTAANPFERFLERMSGLRADEEAFAPIAGEGDEVRLSGMVITLE